MWSESSPPPWANQDEPTPAAPTDAQVRAKVLRYQASSSTDADADAEKKKAYAASIPLAFEKEANDIVATKQLEPWSRIGFLHIACQVLPSGEDDLGWQFELADEWFRHVEGTVWYGMQLYGHLIEQDPALAQSLEDADLDVFRYGFGGRDLIDALRERVRRWAQLREEWTVSPLVVLAYVRRHALFFGEDEGYVLEPTPVVGACAVASGDDACLDMRPTNDGMKLGVFVGRGGAATRQPVRRNFGEVSWCYLALQHGVCRERTHERDVACIDDEVVAGLLELSVDELNLDDGERFTFHAEAPGPQFPFCTTRAGGAEAYICRLAACRDESLPEFMAAGNASLPHEYDEHCRYDGVERDEALAKAYAQAETEGTAGTCGHVAMAVADELAAVEAHPACRGLLEKVIAVCECVLAECDDDPIQPFESELMTPGDLLALNDDWEQTNPKALLRALRLDEAMHKQAARGLRMPAHKAITTRKGVLTPKQCAALRAVAVARASARKDTVDGLPDRQVNLDVAELEAIVGAVARDKLWRTIGRHYEYDVECFLRAYAPGDARRGIPFHCDAAHVTANVALCDDGELYACAGHQLVRVRRGEGDCTLHDSSLLHAVKAVDAPRHSLILFFRKKAVVERPEDFLSSPESSDAEFDYDDEPTASTASNVGGLPSDAALQAMTGTELRKLMARRGVGRGPQDRKEDFIDKLKAGAQYVNKPNPYKRGGKPQAFTRRRAPPSPAAAPKPQRNKLPVGVTLEIGSRVLVWGKPATVTSLPGGNGWWKVRVDGQSAPRAARAGNMSALTASPPPPSPALPLPELMDAAPSPSGRAAWEAPAVWQSWGAPPAAGVDDAQPPDAAPPPRPPRPPFVAPPVRQSYKAPPPPGA